MLSLVDKLIKKEFEFLSKDHIDYVEKLNKFLIGKSINLYKDNLMSSYEEKDIEILVKAKEARNFICHEVSHQFLDSIDQNSKPFLFDKKIIKDRINEIAAGDYIVSRWSYEFHEKESGNFKDMDIYVKIISKWVFSYSYIDLRQLEYQLQLKKFLVQNNTTTERTRN